MPARTRQLIDEPGVRLGVGGGILFVATSVVVAADLPVDLGVAALATVTLVLSAPLSAGYALLLGLSGWALADGFAVHEYGELGFARPELLLLAGFLMISVLPGSAATRRR